MKQWSKSIVFHLFTHTKVKGHNFSSLFCMHLHILNFWDLRGKCLISVLEMNRNAHNIWKVDNQANHFLADLDLLTILLLLTVKLGRISKWHLPCKENDLNIFADCSEFIVFISKIGLANCCQHRKWNVLMQKRVASLAKLLK